MVRLFLPFLILLSAFPAIAVEMSATEIVNDLCVYIADKDRDVVVEIVKKYHRAVANGDVITLKKLSTSEFYKENFPGSDDYVRKTLLSVPVEKRMNLVEHINKHCKFTVIFSRPRDSATVISSDTITQKEITFQLFNDGNGWFVCDYYYK